MGGGGMYNCGSSPILTNVVISGNYAYKGGGIYNYDYPYFYANNNDSFIFVTSNPVIRNSIIWGNDAIIGKNVYNYGNVSNPTYYHSLVEHNYGLGGAWDFTLGVDGGGNLPCNADPLFVNPMPAFLAPTTAGDYHLTHCSPAIDKGNNAYFHMDSLPDLSYINVDLDSNSRIFNGTNGIVDLGAYETPFVLPKIQNADTAICYGDTATITLNLTGAAPYQFVYTKDKGISFDTVKNIANNLFNWNVSPSDTMLYKFITAGNTNCVFAINDSLQIKVLPHPTVTNIPADDILCNGEKTQPVVFEGNATDFEWIASGNKIDSIPIGIQTGDFEEYVVENKGNTSLTSRITVTPKYAYMEKICAGKDTSFSVTVYPEPTLTTVLQNDTLCSGEKTQPVVCEGNTNVYEWLAEDSIKYIPAGVQTGNFGEYLVENKGYTPLTSRITVTPKYAENGKTCFGTDAPFSIVVNPSPDTTISQIHNNLIVSGVDGHLYQWYFNGTPIPGATEHIYTYTQNGNYFVETTNKYGCTAKSKEITISNVGVVETQLIASLPRIYPNPTTGTLHVTGYALQENTVIEIFDIYGKCHVSRVTCHEIIDISHLANGLYFLKVDGKGYKVVKE
jgi:hypothetical protein